MSTTTLQARDELLALAQNPQATPFDYIVIGSGAGGGPLAARLALGGRRVLVLEAGTDPAFGASGKAPPNAPDDAARGMREVYAVPAFHAAATEDPDMSWTFSVRHYDDDARQQRDSKYDKSRDPSAAFPADVGKKGGIQYPRSAALGGCTAHYAMIIIRPNDADWDWIAERTNDPSWRSEHMQGYFPKIEKCLYYSVYKTFLHKGLGVLVKLAYQIATLINPRRHLDPGGHGEQGWQTTSFIDPLVIAGIVRGDRTFLRVLLDVFLATLGGKGERMVLLRSLLHLQLLKFLDPNVRSPDIPSRAHLSLISIGTDGKRRFGLREHLLEVADKLPQHLVLATGVHATRLLFEAGPAGEAPRAVGVEVMEGTHLYRASPLSSKTTPPSTRVQYFARREVIVCGGAFNTPQLLMLSGIGDRDALGRLHIPGPRDRAGNEIAPVVHLPGVGRHLQDRYEVSVISEAEQDFSTLAGVGFTPDAPDDPATKQWRKDGSGLYSINGGALAMMMSSTGNQAVRRDPDLFIFGVPAAFRGYYWNWSKELLRRTQGAAADVRNLWTWVILKAYTSNHHGTVRLCSADPLDTPQIDFHSFDDVASADFQGDLDALGEAVAKVREINEKVKVFKDEVQPGLAARPDPSHLAEWIKDEAWGHHACGTCRIGVDRWCGDIGDLTEPGAVLASDFRVHGVQGLRVVDASVFPRIPGYFIVTPTFMIGEKAADTLLAETPEYPRELAQSEAAAVRERRIVAQVAAPQPSKETEGLPADSIGLALSGGGIRSATFCLGVLQSLAIRKKLRHIDMMSSVSGGSYISAFLGRLYTRLDACVADKAERVEDILSKPSSPEIWWLRRHANYIDSGARGDLQSDVGIVLRNLAFVHLWLGAMLFGFFGLARWFAGAHLAGFGLPWTVFGLSLSLWWWLPVGLLLFGVVPLASGYWFVLKDPQEGVVRKGPQEVHRVPLRSRLRLPLPVVLWLVLLGCAVFGLGEAGTQPWSVLGLVVLLLAWGAQEIASWGLPVPDLDRARHGRAPDPNLPPPTPLSNGIRSRLSRALGISLFGLAVSVLWVVLDSLAQAAGTAGVPWAGWSMLGLVPLLPILRGVAVHLLRGGTQPGAALSSSLTRELVLGGVAFGLAFLLLFFLDTLVHMVFQSTGGGPWVVVTALLASAVVGRTFTFLNLSSLQQSYAQKLLRTFLGASNEARVHPSGTDAPVPINIPDPEDDIHFDEYRPQRNGGPLHLVGTCVNDTVDRESGRQLRGDKGLPLCVGPAGLSVGLRHHALWGERSQDTSQHVAPVTPLRLVPDPNHFHVLARRDSKPVEVERLKLGQWMAISGAAYTTGRGRETTLSRSLLLGLLNIRIGYWWDSGIAAGQRPGRFPPSLWRRLKSAPATIFRLQATLLDEWRAWFPGASDRLWYLSDGGHFDNTGLYELIRRRLPFIVAIDAGRDAGHDADKPYEFDDLALVTRQVRLDFGATVQWIDPATVTAQMPPVPPWILSHVDVSAIGRLEDLRVRGTSFSALGRVSYADAAPDKATWILLLKPCLGPGIPMDVQNYAARHDSFPQQSTSNQFFDDDQWEAYRMLGQVAGLSVFR